MLSPDQLKDAVSDAEKSAAVCTRFCRLTAEFSDDNRYRFSHNGTGPRDTDMQVVHATPVLNLAPPALTVKLSAWLSALHRGEKIDLNGTA